MKYLKDQRGSIGVNTVLIGVAIIVFVILPIFSVGVEYLRMNILGDTVKEAIDLSATSAYITLSVNRASEVDVSFNASEFGDVFEEYLKKNLSLNDDLSPKGDSMVDGSIRIVGYNFFLGSALPYTDPETGITYNRPFVDVELILPVKPVLFIEEIAKLAGKTEFEVTVKHKVTLPIDN